jgi:ketosteroid isomerase-like protein
MERADVQGWLERYVEAWRTYDPALVGALFSEDVAYRFHPYDEPVVGRAAVVAAWVDPQPGTPAPTRDEPGTYEGDYAPVAVDGDTAVVTGVSTYRDAPGGAVTEVYDNCWVLRFDDEGRCTHFTEWFVQRPAS